MSKDRCPRCFSELNVTGGYTDDPILTPKGEAGDDYKGFTDIKPIHIQELQTLRAQQEIDAGIAEEDRTTFTEIDTTHNLVNFYRKHLLELRESTEKLLTALGQTKDTYFNYDEEGTEYNIGEHQTDWTDPNLETRVNKFVNIKAYHIEDLRHFLMVVSPCKNLLIYNEDSDSNTILMGTDTTPGLEQTGVGHSWNTEDDYACISGGGSHYVSGYYYTKYVYHYDAQGWNHKTYSLNSTNISQFSQFNFTLESSAPSGNNLICNIKSTNEEYHWTRSYKYDVHRHWVTNYYSRCYDSDWNLLWEITHPGEEWGFIPGAPYHYWYITDVSDDINEYYDDYRWGACWKT